MDKIIKLALQGAGFNETMIDGIILVANATDNATVAIETILGIYDVPMVEGYSEYRPNAELLRYDRFRDRVYFTYDETEKTGAYFADDQDMSLITAENYKDYVTRDGKYHYVLTGKTYKRDSYCSLSDWKKKALTVS